MGAPEQYGSGFHILGVLPIAMQCKLKDKEHFLNPESGTVRTAKTYGIVTAVDQLIQQS